MYGYDKDKGMRIFKGWLIRNFFLSSQCKILNLFGYAQEKMHKKSYNHPSTNIAQACGDRVHTDYCGPLSNDSLGGARFFALFKDEWTKWSDVYFTKNKSEIPDHFESYRVKMETQTGYKIKALQSDNAAEYGSARQSNRLTELGIIH